jgi:hypothetical protein
VTSQVNTMSKHVARSRLIQTWFAPVVLVMTAAAALGLSLTVSTVAILLALSLVPPTIVVLLWRGIHPLTAEVPGRVPPLGADKRVFRP